MKLTNADLNFAVITSSSNTTVNVQIYEDEATYTAGPNPFFEKFVNYTFNLGTELETFFQGYDVDATKKLDVNVKEACMSAIEDAATIDASRFRPTYNSGTEIIHLNGEWVTTV